ncbi:MULTISPECIES: hypothetical protein [Bradyrhizobium]|uniref:Uncharacterized protein n=1 Tax=Bradyrhizobium nanningense TaxID=1325118 RepID=A0A4Q0SGR6_9BRAD|nr:MULTISPECIES: hypothetical protein [Bradyrhizobium]RXH37120.1 hypothetical protein XH99_02910 [Bradyrhizobium nanningense]TQF33481.1 hypothetical protein UNPA324_31020 [Bradyrhizobium sp. UNPA324]
MGNAVSSLLLLVSGGLQSSDTSGFFVLGLLLARLDALGAINSHAVELLRPVEQITLAVCPIVRRGRCVAYAVDRIASHFACALLLAILTAVRRKSQPHRRLIASDKLSLSSC